MPRKRRWAVAFCLYFLLAGGLTFFYTRHATTENAISVQSVASLPPEVKRGLPVRLIVPHVGINVPIQPGRYDPVSKTWNISFRSAYFATVTVPPNITAGATLIYAHNSKDLFGPTADIQPGNEAIIITEHGDLFRYTYTGEDVVAPTDTDVFTKPAEGAHELILLTCSGSWNEKLRLLHFASVNASP